MPQISSCSLHKNPRLTPTHPQNKKQQFGPDLPAKAHAPSLLLLPPFDPLNKDGCLSPITLPPTLPTDTPFALFLERGVCSFEKKALAAQEAGASVVVIYNSEEGLCVCVYVCV